MTPSARASAAIQVLDRILAGEPAEQALTNWGRASRFAGSGDRAGDAITLVGDGVDGWYITGLTGTWTRQA